jgi:xanthine dehydrogenase YagR molybdenum-binding subunit
MARLQRTTREMEGRFEDVWVLVHDEDNLETWDSGAELHVVGTPTPRVDARTKVTGQARYTVDLALPGMLHAAVLRSPVARGRLSALDLEAALAVPGVRGAIGPFTELDLDLEAPLLPAEFEYAGRPLAAVAADDPDAAALGVAAFHAEVEHVPPRLDLQTELHEQRFTDDPEESERGEPGQLSAASFSAGLTVETPSHLQTPLEPHAALARWEDGRLTAWVSTQGIFDARLQLATAFRIPQEHVRVISRFVGGGFGAKQGAGVEALLAAELARRTRRPVRLVNDRHGEQLDGGRRAGTRQSVRIGSDDAGRLTAIEADAVVAMGAGGMVMPVLTPARTLYRCPNVQTMLFPVRLDLRPQNAFRAPGVTEGTAVFEQAIDELAAVAGIDPLAFRRLNHAEVEPESGAPFSGKNLLACYDRAAELSRWSERELLREPQRDGRSRGLGCATQIWWGGGGPPSNATVRVDAEAHALVVTGMQELGTGALTTAALVVAEELGLPLGAVRVEGGDTGPNVYGPVAGGSQTTPSVLPAVRAAAASVRRQLLALAADLFEVSAADLELRDGRVRTADGGLDRPLSDVTGLLGDASIDATGSRGPNPDGFAVHTFGCQIAQVAVDAAVGEVVVEHVWAVHDVGRIINPLTASSQVEGGIIQGLGFALSEEVVIDPTTGVPVNATLDDYKLPTIADTPEITVEFIGVADENMPTLGAKGLGEPPIIPTAAAIANAFAHATGRRASALPLTRARVLEALR